MKANKKTRFFLILSVLTSILTGCQPLQEPLDVTVPPPTPQQNNAISKRFQDVAPNGQTAVDSAIELSHRYAKLSEEMTELKGKNQGLITENDQIKGQLAVLEPELKQAKKELEETNDFLIKMQIELNNWKTDILGYREEMRDASTAQMEILLKIAQAMGAEIIPEQEENKQSTGILTSGEPNE